MSCSDVHGIMAIPINCKPAGKDVYLPKRYRMVDAEHRPTLDSRAAGAGLARVHSLLVVYTHSIIASAYIQALLYD